jgi:hypothetical protein
LLILFSAKLELVANGLSGRVLCAKVLPMACDDWSDNLSFWVQGRSEASRELNKLNQLFGSGKISIAKRETKPHSTKPGKQYLHFQGMKSLQHCSTAMEKNFSILTL